MEQDASAPYTRLRHPEEGRTMAGVVSYAGQVFRTELHARWAVFLDTLNMSGPMI